MQINLEKISSIEFDCDDDELQFRVGYIDLSYGRKYVI